MPPSCLLIRPARFGHHAASGESNAYVHAPDDDGATIATRAAGEADGLIDALRAAGVEALVLDEREKAGEPCPDAVFPNNWFSVHRVAGVRVLVLYPMHNPERRRERWWDLRERLGASGVRIDRVIDLTGHEDEGRALEGTGSLVFDDDQRAVYAAVSARTDEALVRDLARQLGYEPVLFEAHDRAGGLVYHTNVLMSVAPAFAIACLERITNDADRARVRERLCADGRTLVEITAEQMDRFCGNVLALPTRDGTTVLAMSAAAHGGFTSQQRRTLGHHATLLAVPIPTIEHVGGGSVRCMIARLC